MLKLVKPDSPSRLSEEGESLMNDYAEKGFRIIYDQIPVPPANLDTFLISYYEKILQKVSWQNPKNTRG